MLPTLEAAELPADAVEVGRIADAWGVKGWFKVHPHSAQPEALFSSRRWFLQPPAGGSQVFRLPVREAREHADCVVASSPEVPDRNAAEALKGARVFVPRSSFPTPDEGEYYWVDLIGLAVRNREGVALGTVRELLSTGPQTTLVLQADPPADAPEGARPVERMIPFVAAFIDQVDLQARSITVDWQPDY
ncbi:ribosome maturation factor RimM [Xenophilus sp. Marseille-Q4582]|uniref:ribosome maturation factor RimM n=1 Tax=Xenophilus sp. Marseille-Q4582 TaxID=2866600 RepID=UPI001CE3E34E|nr:ribosome maturation factor RimM [Xenophilus sp. Marseille-Q4582]